jgi:CheY-like chemotaxis protein
MDPIPCQKDRILIVDDDEAVRRSLKQALSSEFPHVTIDVATNGMEAMKIFHSEHPSVVLMDLFMPLMSGEQAYRGIERLCKKENWVMPAIVFCTAYNPSREIHNLTTTDPSYSLLQKPVKHQVLLDTIRSRLAAL